MIEGNEETNVFLEIIFNILFTAGLMLFIFMFCAVFNIANDSRINLQIKGEIKQDVIRKD